MNILCAPDTENVIDKKNGECYFCKSKNNLCDSHYDKIIIDTCFLCHVIVNFKKEYMYYGLLCQTNLEQTAIINKTKKFYEKNGYVPFPTDLDDTVQKINISPYLFSKFDKSKLDFNFAFFFTNNIKKQIFDEIDDALYVEKKTKKIDLLQYYDIPEYVLTKENQNIIKEQMLMLNTQKFSVMTEVENDLKTRFNTL